MLPVALIAVGCVVLVFVASFTVYRLRAAVHVSGDSEDEDDDDDDDELVSPSGARPAAETAALMDGEDESSLELKRTRRRSGQAGDLSLFAYLVALVRPSEQTKIKKAPLMHRRNKGVKKIHKPYFYPLLDETAQWYADWETRRQQVADADAKPVSGDVDVRIDKPSLHDAAPPRDLLDSRLDCASLVSFRAGSHTVIPIAAI